MLTATVKYGLALMVQVYRILRIVQPILKQIQIQVYLMTILAQYEHNLQEPFGWEHCSLV
ncbi:hypothetical protein [Chryseobacterium sp. R2ACT005]|uniref:hypothetical protein n=1 Tax=Chryseobacterium sp. R2ACT005 TaxID=3416668 RepID=UPI003CEAC69E